MRGFSAEKEHLHQSETDWIFGGNSPSCIAAIPEMQRDAYLPIGEVQRGIEDFMDCATRGPLNVLEAKFTYLYWNDKLCSNNKKFLEDNGYIQGGRVTFSDRFIAIKSGTTTSGNSMKAPLDAIYRFGLIPKAKLSATRDMDFAAYHRASDITPDMETLGQQFKDRFTINYERVPAAHFGTLYRDDFIVLAGYAWPPSVNGIYPAVDSPFNHVFDGIHHPVHTVFDNYEETPGDFIKQLAPDYKLYEYGYRVYISKEVDVKTVISLYEQAIAILKKIYAILAAKH